MHQLRGVSTPSLCRHGISKKTCLEKRVLEYGLNTVEKHGRKSPQIWTTENGQWRTGIGEWTTDNPERMDNGRWNGQLRIDIKMKEIDCKNGQQKMWKRMQIEPDRSWKHIKQLHI